MLTGVAIVAGVTSLPAGGNRSSNSILWIIGLVAILAVGGGLIRWQGYRLRGRRRP
jgi:hypothetical protein